MHIEPIFYITDILVYILILASVAFAIFASRYEHWRVPFRHIVHSKMGVVTLMILTIYVLVALLDSIHFRILGGIQATHLSGQTQSLLDWLLRPLGLQYEHSYSAPLATHLYNKTSHYLPTGEVLRIHPRLHFAGAFLANPNQQQILDIIWRTLTSLSEALLLWFVTAMLITFILAKSLKQKWFRLCSNIRYGRTQVPWRLVLLMVFVIFFFLTLAANLATAYHIFGTDKIGQDIFYISIKSIRTGLLIGTLSTLVMLPFAILLGTMAGYFGGWIDDVIQYIYTTLSSIPGVLLIAAVILALQIYISNHPQLFPTIGERADARLFALCVILGITSWTTLCRLLRGETLKVREMDYIQASKCLGANEMKIILKHVIPNVMHLILIAVALDFSGLVLAEAVLSYVGVGVDPTTMSWGNMINAARLELAREPVVWWPLLAAFVFMFVLVLAANLFADVVRDAFDPRLRGQA